MKLNISIDGVNVVDQQLDLCVALPQVNLMCPLKMGSHTLSISVDLPDSIPSVSLYSTSCTLFFGAKNAPNFLLFIFLGACDWVPVYG